MFHKLGSKNTSPRPGNLYYVNKEQLKKNLAEYTKKVAEAADKEERRRRVAESTKNIENNNKELSNLRR